MSKSVLSECYNCKTLIPETFFSEHISCYKCTYKHNLPKYIECLACKEKFHHIYFDDREIMVGTCRIDGLERRDIVRALMKSHLFCYDCSLLESDNLCNKYSKN